MIMLMRMARMHAGGGGQRVGEGGQERLEVAEPLSLSLVTRPLLYSPLYLSTVHSTAGHCIALTCKKFSPEI